jgi:hypothetical protein
MKKECIVWELDQKNFMNGSMTLIPKRRAAKQEIIKHQCTHKLQKMPLMWLKGLGFRVLNLITNNIFLDRSLNYLLIHVKFIDQIIENHDKRRDRMQKVLESGVPKVVPQP